ncbi:MAG TPA: RNA polymerase sigma factor [Usitatibacter sp.]|jgi:RNA polymerase sigma-70 factor (ECF subfamily)|nr:RNA polymerase sigma factor [Usitatibacter sp.]
MEPSDEELMLAYAGGDAGAFETLYARHKGPVFRYVLRSVKARGEADELFQDVWMRAIEARGRYRPEAKFTTWLYTIAHHRLIDHWRARGLALVSLDDEESSVEEPRAGPASEPARMHEARETARRLEAAIAALPLAQREAFLLHHEGELTVAGIAAATGANEEAAKSRLRYAMKKLQEALDDDGT